VLKRLFACPECDNGMTPGQKVLGWCYLPMHFVVIPLLVTMLAYYAPGDYTGVDVNKIYFGLGFAFVLLVMGSFLRRNFDVLLDHPGRCALCLVIGFAADYALSIAVRVVLLLLEGARGNPNNAELYELSGADFGAMLGISVFLGPVVEETLFRGVVFGTLRKKSRVAAYTVSILLFALMHVWQYVLVYADWRILIYMLEYVPVSFVLAWQYERSGSIWTPIVFHMLFNALSFFVMAYFM